LTELTFTPGADPDLAWSKVQNKLQLAMASLPDVVQRQGVKVSKSTKNYLLIVGLISEDGSMNQHDLVDYCQSNLEKVLARVPGVGEVETIMALRAYNVEVSAGQFGGAPAMEGQRLNASIIVQHLLKTPDEFAAIPIRTNPDGSIVRIRDVGRTELGTERYDILDSYNGKPGGFMAIRKVSGANSLKTADAMGNIRATLIPTIAVPVVLLGTFAVLGLFGFSINMLTMFAMVLAIGLLVDDAIVVVENVERIMSEEGLSPREATARSMDQITSALIGIGLVLSAVFGPMAFFAGSTGVIYRQFSVTIIASMMLSVLVALILTPVLCVSLLKSVPAGHEPADNAIFFLRPFFRWFDRFFFRARDLYVRLVGRVLAKKLRYLFIFLLIVVAMGYLFQRMPTAYLPDEDQGILFVQAILPSGSTLEQTEKVMEEVKNHFLVDEKDAVKSFASVSGYSFSGRGQNVALGFVHLKDWKLRGRPDLKGGAVAGRAMQAFSQIRNAMVFAFPPPAVIELGNAKGFDFQLQDRGGLGHEKLMAARNQLLGMAAQDPRLIRVRPNGMEDVPEYRIDVDWEKAGALGVPITSIHNTIAAAFGSAYVNDFIQAGRVKRVYAQADAPFRMLPKDLKKLYVRNSAGKMVPFSSFASGHWTYGSPKLERYNGFPSINIWGEPAPGRSSGETMQAMEEFVSKLPKGIGFDWTGLSYQERMATSQGPILYAFSIFVIFLCLAALYESWPIPIAILLTLPLGVIGGVVASSMRGLPNDVYFQIGLLTILGLTTKNAILIVQFARARVDEGARLTEATLEAAKLRLRPIVMTSLAFGFGVLPLALASGAGAGAQKAIGTGVLGGMVTSTFLVTLFAPLFYVMIYKALGKHRKRVTMKHADKSASGGQSHE